MVAKEEKIKSNISSMISYNPVDDLSSTDYSDNTTQNLRFLYDRRGQKNKVTDDNVETPIVLVQRELDTRLFC